MTWIEIAKKVNNEGQALFVDSENKGHINKIKDCVLLDAYTATMLVQLHEALKEENKTKFEQLPLGAAVELGWKIMLTKEKEKRG